MSRVVSHRYVDPLTALWLDAAARIGLRVTRSAEAYATTDGAGTLSLGTPDTLDSDDSVAQMVFHELCHSLVQGRESFAQPDWGLPNIDVSADDEMREHACLRVQWVLAGRYGLRGLFAPTTDFRAFWDGLPQDALANRKDPSVQAAIAGLERVERSPWSPALTEALEATQKIAAAVPRSNSSSLWSQVIAPPTLHPTGLPGGTFGDCGTCAWRYEGGPIKKTTRCRQADGKKIDDAWPGCERYEPAPELDCLTCGACCREAYQSVEVSKRDPFNKSHPELVVDRVSYREVLRTGDRCSQLSGGHFTRDADGAPTTTGYSCTVYDDRPRTCREFTLGSEHCLTARRRVGLSL